MRRLFVLFVTTLLLSLTGCGGGGAGSGGNQSVLRTDTFSVGANQAASQTFGSITVTVPTNAFPAGSQLTLTQYRSAAAVQPPNQDFAPAYPPCQLGMTAVPSQPITISVPAVANQTLFGALQDGTNWDDLPTTLTSATVSVTLPLTITPQSQTRLANPFKAVYNWAIGLFSGGDLPDTDHQLHLVAGNGPLGPNSAVIVHGILDSYQSMTPMAAEFQKQLGFTNVYSLAYDWRIAGATAAGYLVNDLAAAGVTQPKSLTLIGHSRGVTVVRYALEALNATATVKSAILICGPNEGAVSADLGHVLSGFVSSVLDEPLVGGISLPLLNQGDPCVAEIGLNSTFLNTLNSKADQRGAVSYYLVAATKPGSTDSDGLVGTSSALGTDLTWPNQTDGAVHATTVSNVTHDGIKTDLGKIDQIAEFVRANPDRRTDVNMSLYPVNPVGPNGEGDGWDYTITVTNSSSQTVTLDDLLLDTYDRNGGWQSGSWYDQNTTSNQFFPNTYYYWGVTLASGQSTQLNITTYADSSYDPIGSVNANQQALSVVPTLHYALGANHYFVGGDRTFYLQTTYNGVIPGPPGTRAPHPTHGGGQSTTGPVKK